MSLLKRQFILLKSHKPFYGWIIIGVTFLIGFTEVSVFQNVLSIFLKPMAAEFGWSRTLITGSITVGSICGGLIAPFVGPILDRHGPRMLSFLGLLVLSCGLVSLSFISRAWQLYVFLGIGRLIAVGALSLATTVTISNWFVRRRGRAMGIARLGVYVGGATFPPFVQFMILFHGWRVAWAALGIAIFILSAIPSAVFLRRRPEDIGLLPDDEKVLIPNRATSRYNGDDSTLSSTDIEPKWTRSQAVHTSAFWTLAAINCLFSFAGAGISFHLFPFLTDQGFTPESAALMLSALAISAAFGSFFSGFSAERFQAKNLLTLELFVCGAAFLVFMSIPKSAVVYPFAILFGMLRGGMLSLVSIIWADFFGRIFLGSIYGLVSPFRLIANALGPIFAAFLFDSLGSYEVSFHIFAILFFVSGLLGLAVKPPGYFSPAARERAYSTRTSITSKKKT